MLDGEDTRQIPPAPEGPVACTFYEIADEMAETEIQLPLAASVVLSNI
ncbi:hypothetical protein [Rhizobium ruizarguesonis]|nr:hypothetical protein [Rhizobium ruizarguesonis]